jgi:small GTP-binding protein
MLQKKICLLGSFAVGKTSLVTRFVKSLFSDKYLTTVGVKIDKKELTVGGQNVMLLVWDLAGDDEFLQVRMSYIRGAAGYLLVVDGTRLDTLDSAYALHQRVTDAFGPVPFLLVINKVDLHDEWVIDEQLETDLAQKGWEVRYTSAKTGDGVEEAFLRLTQKILGD